MHWSKYLRTRPKPYQIAGIQKLVEFQGRCLLADEPGLGKTLQALAYASGTKVSPIVTICPMSVKENWAREARMHVGWNADIAFGQKPRRVQELQHDVPHHLIINYDIVPYWVEYIKALDPMLIILDECQRIKNRQTKAYRAVRDIVLGPSVGGRRWPAPYVMGLTGTPIENRPEDIWAILNLLRPDLWPNFFEFGTRHCQARIRYGRWDFSGASNLKQLNRKLVRKVMVRRRKVDVLKDLPPKSRFTVILEKDETLFKEYTYALNNFSDWLREKKGQDAVERASRAMKLAQQSYLRQLCSAAKYKSALEWIRTFLESGKKLIVFGVGIEILKRLQNDLAGYNPAMITGSTPEKRRQGQVDKFQKDKTCAVFIGNVDAAGVGLTLTAASDVAFLELVYNPAKMTQAEDRADRIGQTMPVTAHYLCLLDTVEERMAAMLQMKQGIATEAIDGESVNSFALYDHLLEQIKGKRNENHRKTKAKAKASRA
jgi:SWI/SNF-related matrix-associated actin-dependent regulator 1 of chromatin subfamily A